MVCNGSGTIRMYTMVFGLSVFFSRVMVGMAMTPPSGDISKTFHFSVVYRPEEGGRSS